MAPATATQLRLVWLGGAGQDWLRRERRLRLMHMVMAIRLPDIIAPLVDTGCGRTPGTVPPITPLSDAIFPYGLALLVSGVIGSKKPTKVSSSLF